MSTKTLAIVSINESEHIDEAVKAKLGGELHVLYVYDPNEETFCCEVTPSHYLVPFDYYGKKHLSDEDDSDLRGDLIGEPKYMHVRTIENMDDQYKTTVEVEWDDEEDFEGQANELMSANPEHPPHALAF